MKFVTCQVSFTEPACTWGFSDYIVSCFGVEVLSRIVFRVMSFLMKFVSCHVSFSDTVLGATYEVVCRAGWMAQDRSRSPPCRLGAGM